MQNTNTKKTINEKELEILNFWNENKIFEKSVSNPAGKNLNVSSEAEKEEVQSFSFYDGPPFATGLPHNGHILAGTIKDAIPRYHTMQGKSVRRVWGWDCHGLPIENMIEKELTLNSKKDIEDYGVDKFNKAAADSVLRYESEWKKIIPRLGRWVDMQNSYKTMDWTYTESVWWAWKTLYDKHLAYEGHKIMHICPRCETPLAQSEVGLEYHDITDMTVTTEFELVNKKYNNNPLYILAWTTTPWTLPGNTALAVNKNIDYAIVESISEDKLNYFIVAKNRVEKVFAKSENFKIVEDIDISDYIGERYKPVFDTFNNEIFLSELENSENIFKVWHADFITDDSGTGIAHEAPAFGSEDMELAKANGIPVIKHVNMNGTFTKEVQESLPELAGLFVKKKDDSISTDIEIVKLLAHSGKLFSKEKIVHSYPLCWRCKTPLLNYATSSWFVDVPKIKEKLISENQKVKWVPEHVRDGRFGRWLEGAREWAVSRRRYWGAPLPIWRSVDGVETKVIGSLAEIAQPSKNKYYVMRHGEAIYNIHGSERYDSSNSPENNLTVNGTSQVTESAQKLKDKKIDIIISSPFARTKDTSFIVARTLGIKEADIIFDERLREHGLGELDGLSFEDAHKVVFTKLANDLNSNERGLESWNEMKKRSTSLVIELEEKYKGKNILIVTHLAIVKSIINSASFKSDTETIKAESRPNFREHNSYIATANFKEVDWKVMPRDESGAINLHKPYIDNVILKDSRGVDMKIIGDVFDCWFESGSMPYAQLHYPFENVEVFDNNFPADFIAEGMDQTRGWFYSLINLGVGLFYDQEKFKDKHPLPFKNVIVNGTVMAADGKKMSKSEKNYTDPMMLVEKYGADALRFSLANSPVMQGENILFEDKLVEEAYKKNIQRLENVIDFYNMSIADLGSEILSDYISLKNKTKNIADLWIQARLTQVEKSITKGYEGYKLDLAVQPIPEFIDDLSTWYLKTSRERIKDKDNMSSSVDSLATLKYILVEFSKLIAPMMPFLAERIYQDIMQSDKNKKESVHLESWPKYHNVKDDLIIVQVANMKKIRDLVSEGLMLRQKINIPVRQPLESFTAKLSIMGNLQDYEYFIKEQLNVKKFILSDLDNVREFDINITADLKREGDQRELSREIKDMRKEMNLVSTDFINLVVTKDKLDLVDEEYKKDMKIRESKAGDSLAVTRAVHNQ